MAKFRIWILTACKPLISLIILSKIARYFMLNIKNRRCCTKYSELQFKFLTKFWRIRVLNIDKSLSNFFLKLLVSSMVAFWYFIQRTTAVILTELIFDRFLVYHWQNSSETFYIFFLNSMLVIYLCLFRRFQLFNNCCKF